MRIWISYMIVLRVCTVQTITGKDVTLKEGDWIALNGSTGEVIMGGCVFLRCLLEVSF